MEHDPKTPGYSTGDKTSFAYTSARERWPIIITQAIDDVYRSISPTDDPAKSAEGKNIVNELGQLKYQVQHDRELTPLPDDGYPDVALYNKELEKLGKQTWLNTNWLYSECYLYRRMSTFFSLSTHWKDYDVFARQKIKTFRSSRPAVLELAARYTELVKQLGSKHHKGHQKGHHDHHGHQHESADDRAAEELLFREMCEICLWGNATDLSLLTTLSYDDIQKLQGSEARKNAEANVLINELPAAFSVLKKAQEAAAAGGDKNRERRVDIVLDNAGFELYVDLILAGYLLSSGLATLVVLHPKDIPWFVSDVLPGDLAALLSALANPKGFFETASEEDEREGRTPEPLSEGQLADLAHLFQQWAGLYAEGKIILRPSRFWTHPGSFWRLPSVAPEVYEDLKQSELVIFKGDLNYRKLTGDAEWDPTTPFTDAIGPLGPGSGVNVLALRTCKADVVVGLKSGLDEEIRAKDGGEDLAARKWAWNGKWAVVSYSQGR